MLKGGVFMILMFFSLTLGWLGFCLGSKTGIDFWVILLSVTGFFLPPFYILEKLIVNKEDKERKK